MARPIANPITYGTIVTSPTNLSNLDTSFGAIFTSGFNDSSLGWVNYAADTGTANAYSVTLAQAPSSYAAGMCVAFTPQNSNTGASTINVNALGTKAIVTPANIALNGGEIQQNQLCVVIYDGTSFRIHGECPLVLTPATQSAGFSANCAGYTSIFIAVNYSIGSATTSLNNVSVGVPIQVNVGNVSGGNAGYAFAMTTASGATVTSIIAVQGGQAAGIGGTNITSGTGFVTINSAVNMIFTGSLYSSTVAYFNR